MRKIRNINLTTSINSLGYGIVGLNTLLALNELGCKTALWSIGAVEYPRDKTDGVNAALDAALSYDREAPSIRISPHINLAQHVGKGVHAAISYFERDRLHAYEIKQLQNQDVVIASSEWMRKLLAKQIRGPKLAIARPGVDPALFHPYVLDFHTEEAQRALPYGCETIIGNNPAALATGSTVFLVVGKWEIRKGHDVLASLFSRAFTERDNFKLILVTVNPFLSQAEHDAWAGQFAMFGDKVEIHHSRLPDQASLARIMAQADCGVFLSRAEGWNLDAAEMLAMGKHILITNFSAHTEFATPQNAWLVDIDELEPCFDGKWFNGFGCWAKIGQPQQDQAISHLRAIHHRKQLGQLDTNWPGIETMKQFTWKSFAQSVLDAVS